MFDPQKRHLIVFFCFCHAEQVLSSSAIDCYIDSSSFSFTFTRCVSPSYVTYIASLDRVLCRSR